MMIPLIKPYITEEVKAEVNKVLDSGYLTEGPVTREFEDVCREYIGCEHVLALCNCTVGLEMALRVLNIGPGDEVIVPDYTYPATANVVNIVGAEVVMVDVSSEDMLIDYDALEEAINERTKAVMPVSLFGNPLNWDRLNRIKEEHGLWMIEDAACSIGATYHQEKVGNQADISVFSLHPRKFITTGEGGLIATNNRQWADWMLSYKHFGIDVHASRLKTSFNRIGSNYKLSNVLSAIGLVQMKHIDELLSRRRKLAADYTSLLSSCDDLNLPQTTPGGEHAYQSFCIFIENRNEVIQKMREAGIEVQIGTYSLHMQKAFADNRCCRIDGEMAGSKYAFDHCLTLPLYHELTFEEQKFVVHELKSNISKSSR
jgi:perosamine synthetase